MGIHFVTVVEGRGQGHADVLHALDVGARLDPHGGKQLARTAPPATRALTVQRHGPRHGRLETVFRLVRKIGMRGPEGVFEVVVIGRSRGGVGHDETQGVRGDNTVVGLNRA